MSKDRDGFDNEIVMQPKLVIASQGAHKEGKTRFALTGPEPIYILDVDAGVERAIEEFPHKDVRIKRYRQEYIKLRYSDGEPPRSIIDAACDQLEKMKEDYRVSLKKGRTVIVDGHTEVYEITRLAEFARTEKVPQYEYGPVNREMKWWCDEAKASQASVLFTHRLTDEYINKERSGRQILDGWKKIRNECDLVIEHYIKEGEPFPQCFHMKILRCGYRPVLNGEDFSGLEAPDLLGLGLLLKPQADWSQMA